jgi:hypothetical protein
MDTVKTELIKASLSLLTALIVLGLGWIVGQRLTIKWNLVQKWRETEIANIQQFYAIYGEFKDVSKVWRIVKRSNAAEIGAPEDIRWSLLARACTIESKNETIIIKLATERHIEPEALRSLGLFRQAIQRLRESIRDNIEIPFSSRGLEYDFFNDIAARVGIIVSSTPASQHPALRHACERLKIIADVRLQDFDAALEDFRKARSEYSTTIH